MTWYASLLRNDLSTFIGKTLHSCDPGVDYAPNWHIDLIAEYLEAVRRFEVNRLVINMPPRSLKSVCVSVAWPAWLLGHDPTSRIIASSYAASLSIKHSIDTRSIMLSDWYQQLFPEVCLSHDQNEKAKFMTSKRGFRMATSVGGSVTGEGGNYLIIDDPINPTQAMSSSWRQQVNRWFDHTFSTRLNDRRKGAIIVVMQRLHQNDLTGHLIQKKGWEHLCLPMIAIKEEIYDFGQVYKERAAGEILHTLRETTTIIERIKTDLGSNAFEAQYQQQPIPEQGNMIRSWWFGRYDNVPTDYRRCVQSWDTAIKAGDHHDASVCLTFYEDEGHSYLIDSATMRYEYPDLKKAVYALAKQWKPQAILIEDRASGQQLIQDGKRETYLPIIPIQPQNDKLTRFGGVSAMIEAGRLLLPQEAVWLGGFEREVLSFLSSQHDDQVDSLTQYLEWLRADSWKNPRIRIV